MQEFSSISVSSYEAGGLADQLTEQSRAGWSVVAIVPTGSTVTAYLSRDTDAAGTTDVTPADTTPVVAATPTSVESAPDAGDDAAHDAAPDETSSDTATDPVAEAPGWAAGGAEANDQTDQTVSTDDAVNAGDQFTVADEQPAETTPAADQAISATAGGAAPAGWYADPSSRFELRYWDGNQWTEHVSRAGQQYTDPPVA